MTRSLESLSILFLLAVSISMYYCPEMANTWVQPVAEVPDPKQWRSRGSLGFDRSITTRRLLQCFSNRHYCSSSLIYSEVFSYSCP